MTSLSRHALANGRHAHTDLARLLLDRLGVPYGRKVQAGRAARVVDIVTPERRDWIEGKATYFAAPAR
ncbi:MAG TPA: hypothetical protein VM694_25195 [Polyangium sp.]|nr:hypothetical protein [Polyangium sp.]